MSRPANHLIEPTGDCTTTEEMSYSSEEESLPSPKQLEAIIRDEVQLWLALHGQKLLALEASKFLAKEQRKRK